MRGVCVSQKRWQDARRRREMGCRQPALRRVSACGLRRSSDLEPYRRYTEAMLRRYFRTSMEAGRVPSMLGREMFRGKVTSYAIHGFDDAVIFVHDVERCLGVLDAFGQTLIYRIAIQEYTQAEAASMMKMSERTVMRRYRESLDELTSHFLRRKLMLPLAGLEACQESEDG